jgi:hypothetical protein
MMSPFTHVAMTYAREEHPVHKARKTRERHARRVLAAIAAARLRRRRVRPRPARARA